MGKASIVVILVRIGKPNLYYSYQMITCRLLMDQLLFTIFPRWGSENADLQSKGHCGNKLDIWGLIVQYVQYSSCMGKILVSSGVLSVACGCSPALLTPQWQ